nr:MAG TPA: hypothetical protein [Caudoviricetes sp.]
MVRQTNTLLYPCCEGRGVYIVFFHQLLRKESQRCCLWEN